MHGFNIILLRFALKEHGKRTDGCISSSGKRDCKFASRHGSRCDGNTGRQLIGGCGQREFGDDCAGRRVDHLMATAVGDHWCAVDPATGSIRLGNHRPTVTEPGSYLYGFRGLAGQLTSFSIVHIGFGDEIRAQS